MSRMNDTVVRSAVGVALTQAVLALAVLAFVATGCQRRTNIVMIPGDSTNVAAADSAEIALRDAQQMWDAGNGEAAAAATAKLLAREFTGREPGGWRERASYLLDSLGVGGECADAPCAVMVNFFSRSDPEGGSWPYLFWCGAAGPALQPIEGKNLHLQAIVSRGLVSTGVGADSVRLVAAAFTRRAPGGQQPLVMTWTLAPRGAGRWNGLQTLGADSLGGYGTAAFEAASDTGATLTARTYRTPAGFVECATCPHAYSTTRFHWTSRGFVRDEFKPVTSPYSTFAAFITSLVAGDRIAAQERVSDPTLVLEAIKLDWHVRKGPWRPAPGADESPLNMTFFRGQKDAYLVHFRAQGQDWVITGFEPVSRSVE